MTHRPTRSRGGRWRPWVSALTVLALGAVVGAACTAFEDESPVVACTDIPEGGCPGSTANCQDPTCSAIYSCQLDGGWTLSGMCPARDAGPDTGIHDARADVNLRRDVDFDVPPGASGGPGCPDLQLSDCTLTEALLCPANECCCCEALFVCDDGGWNAWGQCLDGGELMMTPPPGAPDR
jgi:hypothetical protein